MFGILGRQSDDVWGVVFLVAAAIAALGIYLDLTGPAGRVLRDAAGDLFGWGRLLVPPCLALVGGMLVRGRTRKEPGRVALGCGFLLVGITGLLHLGRGPAHWHGAIHPLVDAGGMLGAVVGAPLRDVLAPWGTAIVLTTLVFLSVLVVTGTPVRAASDHLGAALAASGRQLRRGVRRLSAVGRTEEREAAALRHPAGTAEPGPGDRGVGRRRPPRPTVDPGVDTGPADAGSGMDAAEPGGGDGSGGNGRPPVEVSVPVYPSPPAPADA
ncbi:MAG TPA: DNA translocase FtsK 4TM domain-containing protein, partial [Acidimicrobiales bacterium]|nr:DNA translocase FtsK 4TM domain-containing protein [Acidimicrobiales bacterium]